MSDKLNINSIKWQKKYGDDRGYGSDESKTMADTGDYTGGSTHRSSMAGLSPSPMATRSGSRTTRRPAPRPAASTPPPRRKP